VSNGQNADKPDAKLTVLLVNPFASGKFLSESFAALGVHTVAAFAMGDDVDDYLAPEPDHFDEQIMLQSRSTDELVAALGSRRIDYVLNGSEGAVDFTDRIAAILTPGLGNDPNTSALRSDKFLMHEALAANGLAHIRQREVVLGQFDAADDAFADLTWPSFVKPSRGIASHGVAKVHDKKELLAYLESLDTDKLMANIGSVVSNDYDLTYLLCDFVEGEEYFVDTFSHLGVHHISSIQRYTKTLIDGTPMYRSAELVTDPVLAARVGAYVSDVLTSVGMENGFAHTELFVKSDGEPVLIEVNARASGGCGFPNRLAGSEQLPTQPELLASVLSGERRDPAFRPPARPSARLLFLYHFSDLPLPDLAHELTAEFDAVQVVAQLKPEGYVRVGAPRSVFDFVAIVLCRSDDDEKRDGESDEILRHDLKGW